SPAIMDMLLADTWTWRVWCGEPQTAAGGGRRLEYPASRFVRCITSTRYTISRLAVILMLVQEWFDPRMQVELGSSTTLACGGKPERSHSEHLVRAGRHLAFLVP